MNEVLFFFPMIGCMLVGFFFLFFGVWNACHWTPTLAVMVQKKIPFASLLLALGIAVQSIAGIMLMVGFYINLAALVLIPFDIVAVLMFHPFWQFEGEVRRLNMIIFLANLTGVLGALLWISAV